jgi:lysozyme family protein
MYQLGRGPFLNWESGAFDALKFEGMIGREWDIPSMLLMAEKWNGLGYLRYHPAHMSPYYGPALTWKHLVDMSRTVNLILMGTRLQVGVAAYFKQLQSLRLALIALKMNSYQC